MRYGLCLLGVFVGWASPSLQADEKDITFFEKKIRPVLVTHCYQCHSAKEGKTRGGLALDTREAMHKGGDSGTALIPGNAKDSLLLEAMLYSDKELQMPPKEKLPDDVLADFRKWIDSGAADPRTKTATTINKPKFGKSADELWSLQPMTRPEPPSVAHTDWVRSDIDRFVLARLEEKGIHPVQDAEPEALLRRTYFDLIGLPPSADAVDAFVKDPSPTAYANVVDTLLASPRFGERWGRHWLDVARYAESNGKDRDVLFPHAWRYRDYVIDAFNADKPYDRFLKEQLAGDLLPADSSEQKQTQHIATGFLAIGPKSYTQRGDRFAMEMIDDQIDATSRAMLGLTVSCARCHDHKFDPIPTKDYYSLASIFYSTTTLYGGRNAIDGKTLFSLTAQKTTGPKPPSVTPLQRQLKTARAELAEAKKLKGPQKRTKLLELNRTIKQLQARINRQKNAGGNAKGPFAMAVKEAPKPTDLQVLVRGSLGTKGKPAPRGFLSEVLVKENIAIDPKSSGRLGLAEWVTHPTNPLTARVAVNRIWHHLFGRGIVRTVDNFGSNGEEPTHPELLDYLAQRFIAEGWSTKKLIREIVLSRVYQLGSIPNPVNYEVDPDNSLLWRRTLRRLDVEAIRDAVLAASGKLDRKPLEQSVVVKMGTGEVGRSIKTEPLEEEFNHRSVYLPILRGIVPEMLKVFDFAEPSLVVGQRSITTVPAQALYMTNSPFIIENARTLAQRLLASDMLDDAGRVELAYKRCLGRAPTVREKQLARAYLTQRETSKEGETEQTWTSYCQALLACAEFRYVR